MADNVAVHEERKTTAKKQKQKKQTSKQPQTCISVIEVYALFLLSDLQIKNLHLCMW